MDNLHVLTWRLSLATSEQFEYILQYIQDSNFLQQVNERCDGLFYIETCQRVIIALLDEKNNWAEPLLEDLFPDGNSPKAEYFDGWTAFNHLATVISGLDSVVIGEEQIMGQFRQAYQQSRDTMTPTLKSFVQTLLKIGKNVRKNSLLRHGQVSTIQLGAEVIQDDLSSADHIAVLGTGKMGRGVVNYLEQYREKIQVYTTHEDRVGESLAAHRIAHIDELQRSDILITATSRSHFITEDFIRSHFSTPPSIIMDLGMPRNCHHHLEQTGIEVIDIKSLINHTSEDQSNEVLLSAQQTLEEEIVRTQEYFKKHQQSELITSLREQMTVTARSEKKELVGDDPAKDKTFDQLVNRLIHISQEHLEKVLLE